MREYELAAVYDLAVAEAGGPDASVQALTASVEARGGKVIKVDHWGRRRMAYPINRAIDGDYLVTRIELQPVEVARLESALRIDERVYRHLVVRADELPVPPPPREPRREPGAAAQAAAQPAAEGAPPAAPAEAPSGAPAAAVAEAPAAPAEAPAAESAAAVTTAPDNTPQSTTAAYTSDAAEANEEPGTAS